MLEPAVLQCVVLRDRLRVLQDGAVFSEALADPVLLVQLHPAGITWGVSLHGDFVAGLSRSEVNLSLHS